MDVFTIDLAKMTAKTEATKNQSFICQKDNISEKIKISCPRELICRKKICDVSFFLEGMGILPRTAFEKFRINLKITKP